MNTRQDFEEATAFELLMLETIIEAGESVSNETIDLTDSSGHVANERGSYVRISDNDVKALKTSLLPLAFGAAWKIFDLIVEYEIYISGLRTPGSRINIECKKKYALSRSIAGSSVSCQQQTWNFLLDLYAHTVEHRHCLVHRTARVNEASGALNGTDKSGQSLVTLTREEQIAFANSAVLTTKGVLEGGICSRNEAFLRHYLNQLTNHARAAALVGSSVPRIATLKMLLEQDEEGGLFLDLGKAILRANQSHPLIEFFDVVIQHPTRRDFRIRGRSELMPTQKSYIDLDSPPSWLTFS